MTSYLLVFCHVLRAAAIIGLVISLIISLCVFLDLSLKLGFGYPWWATLIVIPTVVFFAVVASAANKSLKMTRPGST